MNDQPKNPHQPPKTEPQTVTITLTRAEVLVCLRQGGTVEHGIREMIRRASYDAPKTP